MRQEPNADVPAPQPDLADELPDRLDERIEREPVGVVSGETHHLPDVEVPTGQVRSARQVVERRLGYAP